MRDMNHWWGTYDVPMGQTLRWQIGPATLWVTRKQVEWSVGLADSGDPVDHRLAIAEGSEAPDDETIEVTRFAVRSASRTVVLTPLLPDRPVIFRAARPFFVPSGKDATLYVSSPLWLRLDVGETNTELLDVPLQRFEIESFSRDLGALDRHLDFRLAELLAPFVLDLLQLGPLGLDGARTDADPLARRQSIRLARIDAPSRRIHSRRIHSRRIDAWAGVPLCALFTFWRWLTSIFRRKAASPIERILFLDGVPNMQRMNSVQVGENVMEMHELVGPATTPWRDGVRSDPRLRRTRPVRSQCPGCRAFRRWRRSRLGRRGRIRHGLRQDYACARLQRLRDGPAPRPAHDQHPRPGCRAQ